MSMHLPYTKNNDRLWLSQYIFTINLNLEGQLVHKKRDKQVGGKQKARDLEKQMMGTH